MERLDAGMEEEGMRPQLTDLEEALALQTPIPTDPQELARELDKRYGCDSCS